MFIEDGGGVSDSLSCTFVRIYLFVYTFPTSGKSKYIRSLAMLYSERFNVVYITGIKLLAL